MNKLLISLLTLSLVSCASVPPYWTKTSEPATSYRWWVVSRYDLISICGVGVEACAWQNPGGICNIFSYMSEEQAKYTFLTHRTIVRNHELKHCEGYMHP